MPSQSGAQTDRGLDEEFKAVQPSYFNEPHHQISRSIQQERRRANVGGVLSYGGDVNHFGVISEDKHADINQLTGEIDQIRNIMNQLRLSGDSVLSPEPNQRKTGEEERTSLLSILSKVKQQKIDGSSAPLNAEDRASVASFLRQQQYQNQQMMGDEF